ncbi:hypothetical protein FS749_009405 [Ceratobasidium sp. UAMH 11750]|nr:hypothetical protein FS749_009405 [Ceratobasidium sp. UAMH 11750]
MAEQLILAAAAASTLALHVGQVVTVAHTVSKAVAALVHSVQVVRDRHLDVLNVGFQNSDHDFTTRKGRDFGKAGQHFKKGAMFGYDGKELEVRNILHL